MLTRSTTKVIRSFNEQNTDLRFTNKMKVVCDWIDTWTLAVVGGRGMAKSSEIQAERILKVVEDMPGAPLAIICDTYVNLRTNIMPAIKLGWKRKECYQNIHYVQDERPPDEWLDKCSIVVDEFRHTYFFPNGCVLFLGSLDRPSLLAGKSVCHLFSDEAKFQPDAKVDRAFPILRGDSTRYGYSPYFLGMTVTTDMPDISEGEYDWIFRFAKKVNIERIKLILNAFDQLNKFRVKYYNEINSRNRESELIKLQKQIDKWEYYWHKARHEQTFFINVGSLANIQILTIKYFKRLVETLGIEELKKSVLGIRPILKRNLRFYTNLTEKHFYQDGYNYDYFDKFKYSETPTNDSRGLRYIRTDEKLEAGFDTGNMKSLVIAQPDDKYYRLLKFLYTIPPESFKELGEAFVDYFRFHDNKELDLYYDRAANNGEAMGEDPAGKLKDAIEKDSAGNRTGWMVNLKSRKQANIPQHVEYEFMLALLAENTKGLPLLRIDSINCKQVKSSMEKAPAKISYKNNKKVVAKDKSSEKLSVDRLPMESTNPSDAVKYLLCRPEWLAIANPRKERAIVGMK
ncbi:MAG TPA: hypothetical protein VK152_00345 [Paludibacter sp.]|nr:hypothetical protein [Paludibacter sp.]